MIPIIILSIENDDDREFMIRLYKDHRPLLYSMIYPIVKNTDDTEDLIQDIVVKLIDILDFLKGFDHNTLVSYLAEMGKHYAINFVGKASRRKNVSIIDYDYWEDTSVNIDEILIDRMWIDNLHLVWPTLREETQRILVMKCFLNMPDEEIAKVFHIKTNSVRMRLTRARREVKEALEKLS